MSVIRIQNLGFRYPNSENWVVQGLSLDVAAGEFLSIVGGSGVGKSTILRIIAGLIEPQSGKVEISGSPDQGRRRRAMVFQDGRLMPWRRISENINLGLEGLELTKKQKQNRIDHVLELTGLTDFAERWPHQLSGGQVQRVGIARALAVEPDILLMDEPFSAVDAMTRKHLQTELVRIWQASGKAVVFVTHDIEEATYLSDRVIVLGGQPAEIVREEHFTMAREERQGSLEHSGMSDRLTASLTDGIVNEGAGI